MTDTGSPPRSRRLEVTTVYAVGLFQGLSLVAFPAAATILTSKSAYGLSTGQYGALFLPQVLLAITGSLALSRLADRFGLKTVFLAGVLANVCSMTLLVVSDAFQHDSGAYPMLLVATGFLGLGFGVTLSALSTYAGDLFPDRRDVALNSLNVLLGLGTALSPLLVGIFVDLGEWWYLPLIAATGLVALLVVALRQPLTTQMTAASSSRLSRVPAVFWVFAGAVLIYGIGETMFGNWGTTLLKSKGVGAVSANYALATFWAAVTVGRLAIALLSRRVPSVRIYVVLPWAIAISLALAGGATTPTIGILLFALGGLACSGFFPMTIGYGETAFPDLVELAAGWLVAAYQVGYGLAAFVGGGLQSVVSLPTLFRVVAVLTLGAAALAIRIARQERRTVEAGKAVTS